MIFALAPMVHAANVTVPQATGKGAWLSGLATGNYQTNAPCSNGLVLAASSTVSSGWACVSPSGSTGLVSFAGMTGPAITVSTTSDANITLSVITGGNNATFTPAFIGQLSVARGGTGSSSLNTTLVTEGNNLYFTNARAAGAVSLTTTGTSGASTYNQGTGALNIPIYQPQGSYLTASSTLTAGGIATFSPNVTLSTTSDTNILLTIACASSGTCNFTSGWAGTLADGRIASAAIWNAKLTTVSTTTPITGDGTAAHPIACPTCTINGVTSVGGTFPIVSSGGATPTISETTGNLTLTSSNLSFGTGDGKLVLAGTSTNITLTANPTFTNLTTTNASTSGFTASSNSFLATTSITGTLLVSGIPTFTALGNCNGASFAQYTSGVFGCGTPTSGGGGSGGGFATSSPFYITTTYPNSTGAAVGINSSTPTAQLVVQGSPASTTPIFIVSSSTGTSYLTILSNGSTTLSSLAVAGNVQSTATGGLFVNTQTGTGSNVLQTSPTLITPILGVASATALSISGNLYTNIASGNCVQTGAGGLLTGTGSACGSGGGSGNSAFTIGNGLIYNATSTDLVGIGTITPSTTLFVQGKGGTNPFAIASSTGSLVFQILSSGDVSISSIATSSTALLMTNPSGQTTLQVDETASSSGITIGTTTTSSLYSGAQLVIVGNNASSSLPIFAAASSSGSSLFFIGANGLVGIGTSTPSAAISLAPGTTAPSGINFGDATANLYRSAAGTLNTDVTTFNTSFMIINASNLSPNGNGRVLSLFGTNINTANQYGVTLSNNNTLTANGAGNDGIVSITGTVGPTLGNTSFNSLQANTTFNQTGSASGTTRSIFFNPTLTSVYDYRNLENATSTVTLSNAANPIQTAYNFLFNPLTYQTSSTTKYTIATSSTLDIKGAPIASTTSVTLTKSIGLLIESNNVTASTTNAYGEYINAPTGATNNYGAVWMGGNVGIGTSTPSFGFVNVGTAQLSGLTTSAGLQTAVLCLDANNQVISDSVACLASSKRFKEDIVPLPSGLAEVMNLTPVSFLYKPSFNGSLQSNPNYNGQQVGFIAEDVQKVDPRLVVLETSGQYKGQAAGFRYENFTAILTKAIQDVENQVTQIFLRLNTQDVKIQTLQTQVNKQSNQLKIMQQEIIQLQEKNK